IMQKKFGYLGGCLVLIIAIIVGVGLRQRSAHQATPATAHRPVTQTSHVKTTHVATTKPWIKLKRPLQLPILMYHSIS
ncbi:polysaccharide deacetylase family protein, partial [Levilactobacillus zymae]